MQPIYLYKEGYPDDPKAIFIGIDHHFLRSETSKTCFLDNSEVSLINLIQTSPPTIQSVKTLTSRKPYRC